MDNSYYICIGEFMLWMMLASFVIMALVLWKDPKVLRIDFSAIQKFITLMILLTMFRLALFSFTKSVSGVDITSINKGIDLISFWQFGLVFWEDAFFAIPIYYMIDKWKLSKYVWMPIAAALSIKFGLGHIYQFEMAYFATLLIPYLVFYRAGKKFGFGTSMICHILFDMFTFITFKMADVVL